MPYKRSMVVNLFKFACKYLDLGSKNIWQTKRSSMNFRNYWIYYTCCEKVIKYSASLAFYDFSQTRLINSIKLEHSCKILYFLLISGERCAIYDYCAKDPCKHNGQCLLTHNKGYTCDCSTGDPYRDCALNDINSCKLLPPAGDKNYIACIDRIGLFSHFIL